MNDTSEKSAPSPAAAQTLDLGFAQLDLDRQRRQGAPETIYGASKSAEQIAKIAAALRDNSQIPVLATKLDPEKASAVAAALGPEFQYFPEARIGRLGPARERDGLGSIAVVCAGTSDIPIAEEAAVTAESLGNEVIRVRDCGVAGLHRLLSRLDTLRSARVVVAVAGMEGALASVIGGLVAAPVVAVPTSVGYGASFGGVAALLSMLNGCAPGVSVVNIDNGFGAGYLASRINHMR